MPVKLYKMDLSPPVRAALMGCDIFNVPTELIDVNLLEKEHLTPEYLKINPLHTVPTFEDGDLILHDSHAILIYVAEAYGKDDSWYPKDVKQRALVNQKLFFNTAILFPRLRNITYAVIIEGVKEIKQNQLDDVEEAYGFMEAFLSKTKYLAGDHVTIADISAIANVTSLIHLLPLDEQKFPKTAAWMNELTKQEYCQKHNSPGAATIGNIIKERLGSTNK